MFSTFNQTEKPTNGNVKALAAEHSPLTSWDSNGSIGLTPFIISRVTSPHHNRNITQRVILIPVSAVYDPIGLVALYTVEDRLLFKHI